jgi:hypothetical protein
MAARYYAAAVAQLRGPRTLSEQFTRQRQGSRRQKCFFKWAQPRNFRSSSNLGLAFFLSSISIATNGLVFSSHCHCLLLEQLIGTTTAVVWGTEGHWKMGAKCCRSRCGDRFNSVEVSILCSLVWGVALALLICLTTGLPSAEPCLVFPPRDAFMVHASR